jgi:organic radical activating enzyme
MIRLARLTYDECMFSKIHGKTKLVVITGGEPFVQNIKPFCEALLGQGLSVQIETAGSLWIEGFEELFGVKNGNRMHMVCSPKTPTINEEVKKYASAFKYVVGSDTQIRGIEILGNTQKRDGTIRPLASPRVGAPIYLSPMDEYDPMVNEMNRAKVAEMCLKHGYIAGVQMHKLLQIKEPA